MPLDNSKAVATTVALFLIIIVIVSAFTLCGCTTMQQMAAETREIVRLEGENNRAVDIAISDTGLSVQGGAFQLPGSSTPIPVTGVLLGHHSFVFHSRPATPSVVPFPPTSVWILNPLIGGKTE